MIRHLLRYELLQTLRGIRASWSSQLTSAGTIGVGLLLVGFVGLGLLNLSRLTQHLGHGFRINVYLRADAPRRHVSALEAALRRHAMISSVRKVTSQEAYQRLQSSLGHEHELLAGIEPGFLPASLELVMQESDPEHLRPVLALLSASPIVEEVDYPGHWVRQLNTLVTLLRVAGLFLALVVCLSSLYIISSTIRLGLLARRDEFQILRLVGATDRFVRTPVVLEGALQGLVGALLACGLLYFFFWLAGTQLGELFALALSSTRLVFFTPLQLALGLGAGTLLGLAGSRLAVARYLEA